jgi:uncharacterized repeat protein (TIGR03803 family)
MNALRTLHAQLVSRVNVILAFLIIVGLAQVAHSQPIYEELYSFVKEPVYPRADLTEASDGFLYGTTQNGGPADRGTVYKVDKNSGALTVLHAFNYSTDGAHPWAGLTEASDGFLYGTTQSYGPAEQGTVYKVDKSSGAFTVLHAFNYSTDGAYP